MRARALLVLCSALALGALLAPAGAQADFGIESFSAIASNQNHTEDTLAGSHPYEYTVTFAMNEDEAQHTIEGTLSEVFLDLPPGFLGDPLATPRCPRADFVVASVSTCQGNTQVGILEFEFPGGGGGGSALYNLTPTPGSAATIGTHIDIHNTILDDSLRTGSDYGVTAADPEVTQAVELRKVITRIWGLPMDESHDGLRFCIEDPEEPPVQGCSSDAAPVPFLTLPTRCGEELETTLRVRSVQGGADASTFKSPGLQDCEGLGFQPQIKARPQSGAADSPTGLGVAIKIPQSNQVGGRASAQLRDTTVTLPAGLAVNPSAADGLGACGLAQIGFKGKEGTRLTFSPDPPACPAASKVGTVSVQSPLLDHPLPGAVYLARQSENPFGSLLALYVTVDDPITGVVVKLAGEVKPDPQTGQLTATFEENPQLPFEELKLDFFGGPRATLTTPPTCGTYTTQALFTPWSAPEGKAKAASDAFAIAQGAGGGPCSASEAQMPFAPGFEAGTTAPLGGAFSPFVLKLTRENGSQRFKSLSLALPPGLSARLAGVSQCSDAELAAAAARGKPGEGILEREHPSCPSNSRLGTATVGAGSGSPIYVSGNAYLAGPYKGAPVSLAIVTPAIAGPFDLGTVVVRSALYVNESTAQVTVKSDDIPQILEGIPLDIRSVAVKVDRDEFTLNPTSCEESSLAAELISNAGALAPLANRFQVAGCKGLEFKPNLKLSLKGGTKRTQNPALTATVTYPKGGQYANIAKAQVTLPHSEFLEQAHIRTVCTRVQFAAKQCPAGSIYGYAKAVTPLLDKPLEGPVYLRSSSHKLPDLVAALSGQVNIVLDGRVDTGKGGGIRNTFEAVPDAPVSKFVLEMKGGKKSLLVNSENLCGPKAKVKALAHFVAQNGKVYDTEPAVANSCKKKGGKGKKHHAHRVGTSHR